MIGQKEQPMQVEKVIVLVALFLEPCLALHFGL